MILHGRNLLIMQHTPTTDTPVVACAKSCEVNTSCDIIEISSTTNNIWREYITGRKDWSVTLSYIVTADDFAPSMLRIGEKVTLRFTDRDTGALLQGDAFIKTCKVVATINNLTTGSFSFQGTGELAPVTTT